ncbi:hypothetical protein LOTGIDRAFT_237632 [Lottia gigantea]|uniref:JmjC domain-containing protein n=1 Tax=Lottia gigantea TaxID=225164 RepID=V4BBS4_LOTGI|nr:hypothetical protein LOTGIDRAFT_237632 [Lottia gigantea]ESP03517.1 hypothetical protein LOTGIDRAFT_237632 [Lottia gigantea]
MARLKVTSREGALKKIHGVRNPNIDIWSDIKTFFPVLDIQYSSFFAGIFSVIITVLIFSNIKKDEQTVQKTSWQSANLSQRPFTYDFIEAQKQRKANMEMYDYQYNEFGIDKRSDMSLEEFWDVYDGKWPVVITDVISDWPARQWTSDYFIQNYGEARVVMKAVHGSLDDAKGLALPLNLFIKHLNHSTTHTWTYLEDELFIPRRPHLSQQVPRNLYTEEDFFRMFPKEIRPWDCMFLWGTAHSRSFLHIDPYNWTGTNAVLKGHKKWKLFPPGQDHLLSIRYHRTCGFPLDCFKYNSEIDTFTDTEKYSQYKQATYIELDQYPGDFLIIPPGWFHQAYNVEETMAISGQYMNRNNYLIILEEIIKIGNIKREKLPSYFHSLLPPDQVTYLMSLIPKRILEKGKKITQQTIEQIENIDFKKTKEEESRKEKNKKNSKT